MDKSMKDSLQKRYTVYDDPWVMIIYDTNSLREAQHYIRTIVDDFDFDALGDTVVYDRENDIYYKGQDIQDFLSIE